MKRLSIFSVAVVVSLVVSACGGSGSEISSTTVATESSVAEAQTVEMVESTTAEETTEDETTVEEVEEEPIDLIGTWICELENDEAEDNTVIERLIIEIEENALKYWIEDLDSGDIKALFIGEYPEISIDDLSNQTTVISKSNWLVPVGKEVDFEFCFGNSEFIYENNQLVKNEQYYFEKGEWESKQIVDEFEYMTIDQEKFYDFADIETDQDCEYYLAEYGSAIGDYIHYYNLPDEKDNEHLAEDIKSSIRQYNSLGPSSIEKDLYYYCSALTTYLGVIYFNGYQETQYPEIYANAKTMITYPGLVTCSCDDLVKIIKENPLRASNTYNGKYILLTGKLDGVDASGKYINLVSSDKYAFVNIQCFITSQEQQDYIINKNIGDNITLIGKVTSVGEVIGYWIDICEFR